MAKTVQKSQYIVRTGSHKGQYIGIRIRGGTNRKYCWVKNRWDAEVLTLNQAKAIVRNYGGEIYSLV